MGRALLAAVVVVLVAAVGVAAFYALRLHGPGAGGQANLTTTAPGGELLRLGLRSGATLTYNISWRIESPGRNATSASYTESIMVARFASDYLLSANLTSGNKTGTGSIPYGFLDLPPAALGRGSLVAPTLTPLGGVCLDLHLAGRVAWGPRGWGAYVYESSFNGPGYRIEYRGVYNSSNGVMLELNSTAFLINGNQTSRISIRLVLSKYEPGGGALLVKAPSQGSFCAPLVSSDLRLCADGFYRLGNGLPRPVEASAVENATKGPAMVVILNKYCPHCQRFWPNLLRAAPEIEAPVYAIVFSGDTGLSNPAVGNVIFTVMKEAGATGQGLPTPSIIVFPGNGRTPAYRAGEMSASDLVNWANTVLSAGKT